MPKARLTARGIDSLSAGKWMTDYWDDRLPGFGVRVTTAGHKAFVVRYTQDGKKRRMTLGPHPALSLADARDRAREILGAVARGEDPQAEKAAERQERTFADLAEVYLERHAKVKKRSWKEDARILEVDLLPAWAGRKAKSIGRADVSELLDGIVARGAGIMANRTKALVSKIYNFGMGRGLVEVNPAHGVPMPVKAKQRDRVLTEDEIFRLWQVLDSEGEPTASSFRLRLLTAQRGQEVLSLRWSDLDGKWWTIPAEVAKNGRSHRVPLSAQALAVLEDLRPITGDSEWVFASPRKKGAHVTSIQKATERIAERSGVAFTAHDLRRTAASFMTSMGTQRVVVGKILNHAESSVTSVYDKYEYPSEKREALEAWGRRVEEIVAPSNASRPS